VWSLQHTSLAHSLLLVSTTPIILVAYSLITRQPISAGEVAGALLAVAGGAQQH
jgi:drug/metabolite transporter (DMT)-like permease